MVDPDGTSTSEVEIDRVPSWYRWLDRPLSRGWCAFGWLTAVAVFIGMVRFIGGPTEDDSAESVYSTWSIAHGNLACAYSPISKYHYPLIVHPGPFIAPLWPLLSGGLAALARIGHSVPFPSRVALGPNCSAALRAMDHWSYEAGTFKPTVRLGYFSALVLMAGVVALLRAGGRGRRLWEPLVLVLVAFIAPIWSPLVQYYHPQDIVAIGLALWGLAYARRGWWLWAGVLLGLAFTSQQFVLLMLAPLVVVVPPCRRVRFIGAAIVVAALVTLPVVIATSGRALTAAVLGSGNTGPEGSTALGSLHLHGALLVALSRVLPIVVAMGLAWWALQRLGPRVLDPVPLVSLVATSLSLRLVFEKNLFSYYFMPVAMLLVLLYVLKAQIRGELLAWLALVTLAYPPVAWGFVSNSMAWGQQEREFAPFVGMAIALLVIIYDASHHRICWYVVGWLVVVAVAFARLPWAFPPFRHLLPVWYWQTVLVPSCVALALWPLFEAVRDRRALRPEFIGKQRSLVSS